MPLRLTLIRHGVTAWNREKRYQGQLDIPLDEEGLEQARQLAERLRDEPRPDRVLSSDLGRARRTADLAAEALGLEVEDAPAWRERHMGAFQGSTRAELQAQEPAVYQAWRADPIGFQPEGGESYAEHRARVAAAMEDLRTGAAEEVWVFTHGGVIFSALAVVAGTDFPPDPSFRAGNTSLTTLLATPGGWELEVVDCSKHLAERSDHAPSWEA